ncbi:MAG: PAS domain-containing protein, partial [Rhodobacter sp.]|nr:PAS domain-containing protein [Rhodobacter sp.]
MKNPVLVEILEYWERLRDGRNAPLRSEVDPRQIENALEHAFILERVQADHVRFRIAGIQICTADSTRQCNFTHGMKREAAMPKCFSPSKVKEHECEPTTASLRV